MKKIFIIFISSFYLMSNVLADTTVCETKLMRALYEPIEYTCDSGYFLPANTAGCRQCPNGHTCSGGTFAFNPTTSQGIVYAKPIQSVSNNSCSSNFAHNLIAIYEPVTVTLNFYDNNGNTTSGSCTYDGLVILPETPTREGYDFVGWKLVTNE